MAMTKKAFKEAFHDAMALEFAEVPMCESELEYTFSEEFTRKMDNLIAMQEDGVWRLLGMVRRHIAVIAIIILGAFVTSCGVTEVVKYLHYDIYVEVKNEFLENGGALNLDAEFHKLTYIPQNFEEMMISKMDTNIIVEYKNEKGHKISFLQDKAGDCYSIITEELVTNETVTLDGNTVVLFENTQLIGAMWIEDGIYMEILYFGGTDMEELKAMVEGAE